MYYYRPSPYVSAWGPAPMWAPRTPYAMVGASSSSDVVKYGQAAENAAAIAEPELAVWVELRDKVFGVADDLGIGEEIRTLYYGLSTGQRIGGALSTVGASVPIVSGSAILSIAGTISSIASLVGIVVGIASLFGDDEEEKVIKRVQDLVSYWTRRMSIDDFIHAETANVQMIDYLNSVPSSVLKSATIPSPKAREASVQLAAFYTQLKAQLTPDELALFVSLANIGRWQAYITGWNKLKQSERDAIRQYSVVDVQALLELQIAAEKPKTAAIAQKITAQGQKLDKIGPGVKQTHWLAWLGLLAGASALAWFFVPGFQPASLRLLTAARGQLHRVPYISKVV